MAPVPSKPGVLLVHPHLRSPNQSNAETFSRWTSLHYRDLLNISVDDSGASVDACVRGTALEGAADYSHEEKPGVKPAYMYTCSVNDISILKSQPYYDVSRKLNLEQTRSLGDNEKPVGYNNNDKKAMVFDIVDTKFAVYEEIERPNKSCDLRSSLVSGTFVGYSTEIIIRINLCAPYTWNLRLAEKVVDHLEKSLPSSHLGKMIGTTLALYRWAGKEAQPDEHPLIDVQGSAEWMILVLGESSSPLPCEVLIPMANRAIGEILQKFAEGVGRHGTDTMFEYGTWKAEISNKALDFEVKQFDSPDFQVPQVAAVAR